jgi:hypothetical protein
MKSEDIWLEDDLVPSSGGEPEVVKSLSDLWAGRPPQDAKVGIVRIGRARGMLLDKTFALPASQGGARFMLVRLGFEFDIAPEFDDEDATFDYALCHTTLAPARDGEPQPTAYAVLPRRFDEDETSTVQVKIAPSLELAKLKATLGEVGFDITVGSLQPVIVGFKGKNEQEPYWRFKPRKQKLLGEQNVWIVVELPPQSGGVAISAAAAAEIRIPRLNLPWPLRVCTKSQTYEQLPRQILQA